MSARLIRPQVTAEMIAAPYEGITPPPITHELLSYLKRVYAPKLSAANDLRAYDRMVGHEDVIAHLQGLLDLQTDKG